MRSAKWLVAAMVVCAPLAAAEEAKPAVDYRLTRVRVLPAAGNPEALKGARITGSNLNATNGFVEIAAVPATASEGWIEIPIPAAPVYRFVKIEAGAQALSLAEIEFYTAAGKLSGKPFGTADKNNPRLFERALDGQPDTRFDATIANAYVGLELPGDAQTQGVIFEPSGGAFDAPVTLKLRTWPPGPGIVYTTDGATPSRENGRAYDSPIQIEKTTSIAAFAHHDGQADSNLRVVTYVIGSGGELPPLVESYHVGNSLTDTTKGSFDVIARSAGRNITTYYKTIPGCSIKGNWENNAAGFGYPDAWCNDYYKVSGMQLEHLLLQPFPNPPGLFRDGEYGAKFIRLAREYSPDVQPWLYAQWVSYPGIDPGGKVTAAYCDQIGGQSWDKEEPEAWKPPIPKAQVKSWDDAMVNAGDYYRAILKRWNALAPGGKPVRIVPADKALVALEAAIAGGQIPGVSDFGAFTFSDGLHLTPAGAYLVSLTHYACIFGESPEGKVTWATSRLTAEQAKVLQRIAWQVVCDDPDSGVVTGLR